MGQDVRQELAINPRVRFHDYVLLQKHDNLSFETEQRNVRNVHMFKNEIEERSYQQHL